MFFIRKAEPKDCKLILSFIRKLASFEQLENEVSATADSLSEWIFDKKKAEVVFAVLDGKEIGFALFFHNFSTFLGKAGIYLEDLFILQEYRGMGYGTKLIRYLAGLAVERGCGRLEWSCLNWNRNAICVYENLGAVRMEDWMTFRLTGEALSKLAFEKGEEL